MEVKIISTKIVDPLVYIANIARICYNKESIASDNSEEARRKALGTCEGLITKGHQTPFESLFIEWYVKDISRACSHQIVRHRVMSPMQQSQRYVKYHAGSPFWTNVIIPPAIQDNVQAKEIFDRFSQLCEKTYNDLLAVNICPEDARYATLQAHPTTLAIGMNLREFLFVFYPLRGSRHAQWEVRGVAEQMFQALCSLYSDDHYFVEIFLNMVYKNWLARQVTVKPEWAR